MKIVLKLSNLPHRNHVMSRLMTRTSLLWLAIHCISECLCCNWMLIRCISLAAAVVAVQVHTLTEEQNELAAAIKTRTSSGGAGADLADCERFPCAALTFDAAFGGCQTCVFVLERIKKGEHSVVHAFLRVLL